MLILQEKSQKKTALKTIEITVLKLFQLLFRGGYEGEGDKTNYKKIIALNHSLVELPHRWIEFEDDACFILIVGGGIKHKYVTFKILTFTAVARRNAYRIS